MSSTIYFPLINYKYVRKNNIPELTGNIYQQEEVDKVLDEIEQKLNSFKQRKWLDQNITKFSNLFPVLFFCGLLLTFISSLSVFQLGIFCGLSIVTLSLILLFALIVSTLKTSSVDQRYKTEIENILAEKNKVVGLNALWKVGNNNMIEINFKEAWEFDDYYDSDDEDD